METTQLSMRWIPVADATGRTHLECVWVTETPAPAAASAAPHAA